MGGSTDVDGGGDVGSVRGTTLVVNIPETVFKLISKTLSSTIFLFFNFISRINNVPSTGRLLTETPGLWQELCHRKLGLAGLPVS